MEDFLTLKLSRFYNFLTLRSKNLNDYYRALQLSWLLNFRAKNSPLRYESIRPEKGGWSEFKIRVEHILQRVCAVYFSSHGS
jgi:hypothetical protein